MSNQHYRVIHQPQGGSATDITEAVMIGIDTGIETAIDTFKFSINHNGIPSGVSFGVEDSIKIYLGTEDTPTTLIIDAIITDLKFQLNETGAIWNIKGQNKLETVMNNIFPAAYSASRGDTSSSIIINLINQVNEFNKDRTGWTNIGTGQIATTTSTGGSFQTIDYYQINMPAFQQIEELSSNDFTNDGQYIYYLDTSNNLVWKKRPSVDSPSGTITEGVEPLEIKVQNSTFDVVNAAIAHCGDDLNDNPIHTFAYNSDSIGKSGFKWKYYALTDIAKTYIATNPNANNDTVRSDTRKRAKEKLNRILDLLGSPRFKADVVLRGTNDYSLGDTYDLVVPEVGWTAASPKALRIENIKHEFSMKGWMTVLVFVEDEEVAIDRI